MTTTTTAPEIIEELEPIVRVSKELIASTSQLSQADARYLVRMYYTVQEQRIRANGQLRAAEAAATDDMEPDHPVIFVANQFEQFERNTKRLLRAYAEGDPVGRWAMQIPGIAEVLASGLLAHIDIEKAPTVGHIWRFAGLDPTTALRSKDDARDLYNAQVGTPAERLQLVAAGLGQDYESLLHFASTDRTGNERTLTAETAKSAIARRPWNADLKTLCWKVSESFVKVSGKDSDIYGHVYAERKVLEVERNEAGLFREQAERSLADKDYSRDTIARSWYVQGKLPPARIHLRAERYAVKLFLAHWHHVAFEVRYGTPPPMPYILTRPEHTHYIAPPLWPMEPGV